MAVSVVLVSVAEVAAKIDKGFVGVGFSAPFAAGDIEHAGGVDDVVANAVTEAALGASLPVVAKRMPALS